MKKDKIIGNLKSISNKYQVISGSYVIPKIVLDLFIEELESETLQSTPVTGVTPVTEGVKTAEEILNDYWSKGSSVKKQALKAMITYAKQFESREISDDYYPKEFCQWVCFGDHPFVRWYNEELKDHWSDEMGTNWTFDELYKYWRSLTTQKQTKTE